MKIWEQWNDPVGAHSKWDYDNPDTVLYRDKFTDFLKKFRANEIADTENKLEAA